MSVHDVREGSALAVAVLIVCGGMFGVVVAVVWACSRVVDIVNRVKR